jgi:hypothetical protein
LRRDFENGEVSYTFRDLLRLDTNDHVRALVRDGFEPVPSEAMDYLHRVALFDGSAALTEWGRDGLVIAASHGSDLLQVSEMDDTAVVALLRAGGRLLIAADLVPSGQKTPVPPAVYRSWLNARVALVRDAEATGPGRERGLT